MPLLELEIQGYRSLRRVRLSLNPLNVITGPNGSGKSNLYRGLWLLSQMCEGNFAQAICREGGFLSALWAGPKTSDKPVRMNLGFRTDDFSFQISCGFPPSIPPEPPAPPLAGTPFRFDPEIKEEYVWHGLIRKPTTTLLERKVGITRIRDLEGKWVEYPLILGENESVLSQLREPHRFPELFALREELRGWRFYHAFRTDEESPIRQPRVGVRTPVLSHDGSDLAAALQTIYAIGNGGKLDEIISKAFPGREILILTNEENSPQVTPRSIEFQVALETDDTTRPLLARELSDGTLKFLCLAASLLSPRPPKLIALNEPESSLHPDLLPALAELIVYASEKSQIWVSTHSPILTECIQSRSGCRPIQLNLIDGETIIDDGFRDEE